MWTRRSKFSRYIRGVAELRVGGYPLLLLLFSLSAQIDSMSAEDPPDGGTGSPLSREEFLGMLRSPGMIPKVEISERRRQVMSIAKYVIARDKNATGLILIEVLLCCSPVLAGISTVVFMVTAHRWRLRSKNRLRWGFEKLFDTEDKIQMNPKLYAYTFSAKCFSNSIFLVGSAAMSAYYSTCTFYGIYSVRQALWFFPLPGCRYTEQHI